MSDYLEMESDLEAFARDVAEGLSKPQKSLPCRYFYDARGSVLFEEITTLDEYYPTRTEASILRDCAAEIAVRTQPGSCLVEFGSGSSAKTQIILDALPQLAAYVAIDVSESALEEARARLAQLYPLLRVECVVADFGADFIMPRDLLGAPRLGFFPGSTIGNFEPAQAQKLLGHFAQTLGPGSRLVIGVDLEKDPAILLPAYNDKRGVTAAFNLNLLARINRELGADFDLGAFGHESRWNAQAGRVEMHLVSLRDQSVRVGVRDVHFARGESIHTENSHKWRLERFTALAQRSGWLSGAVWCDDARLFSVHELYRGA